MTIGEKIKAIRISKGLTQTELGKLCGTTKQTIFKYETGVVTNIPLDRLEDIANALGVSSAYLMGWENPTAANDGVSAEKRELMNAILDSLNALSDEDLRLIGQVVETIRHRASPERSRD